jgi:plasmid stabilization system protein ParE
MTFRLFVSDRADRHLVDAAKHYDLQWAGLGTRFLRGANQVFDRICFQPRMYGRIRKSIRAAPIRRFSYVVLYEVKLREKLVVVHAVLHTARGKVAYRENLP